MNINDYVNLNLDKNDMATPLNNLPSNYYQEHPNASGTQMMDNLIQQMEQIPQSQPLMLSGKQMPQQQMPQQQMQQQQISQQQISQQQISQQQISQQQISQPQMQIQQPQQQMPTFVQNQPQVQTQTFIPTKKLNSEKEKAIKEFEISSSEEKVSDKKEFDKYEDLTKKTSTKSLTSHINETILAVILYAVISNPFITPLILKYVPIFETYPNLLFGLKVILFAVFYHLVRWLM